MPKSRDYLDTSAVIAHIAERTGGKPLTRMTVYRYMMKGKKNRSGGMTKLKFQLVAKRKLTTIEDIDRFLAEVTA
jgi:hypothetical protein